MRAGIRARLAKLEQRADKRTGDEHDEQFEALLAALSLDCKKSMLASIRSNGLRRSPIGQLMPLLPKQARQELAAALAKL